MNVASGIKTFGIIQLLLDADEINPGKMLIIDDQKTTFTKMANRLCPINCQDGKRRDSCYGQFT